MTHPSSYGRHLAGAMTVAALMVNAPMATAQPSESQARIVAGIDEAVKALDSVPRQKKLSPEAKKSLVEFTLGNTMFVMAHEMGHIWSPNWVCRCSGKKRTPQIRSRP